MTEPTILNHRSDLITEREKICVEAFTELTKSIYAALETYSNVHRGSGHFSQVTTYLFEKAREIVLDYFNLDKQKNTVIFLTSARASQLKDLLKMGSYRSVSSNELGLPVGVVAIAAEKKALPKGLPFQTGGGTTTLISKNWVDWAVIPDKFEAGTPAVINIITFARALVLTKKYGNEIFKEKLPGDTVFDILYQDEFQEFTGQNLYNKLQGSIIGNNIEVPTAFGLQPFINLDHSASTPSTKIVWETFNKSLRQPEAVKQQLINEVKAIIASFFKAPIGQYDIMFTSNTTESVNIISQNIFNDKDIEPVVVNSVMEHSSNELPWRFIPGGTLIRFEVDKSGYFDLNGLENLLKEYNVEHKHGRKRIRLIAVTGASNVLGICNDINQVSTLAKKYQVMLLIDAAQLIAHRRIDINACDIDFLVFSGHKIYAPFGTGGLISRKGLLNYENNSIRMATESGEENIGGITALGKSLLLMQRVGMDVVAEEESRLCAKMLKGMAEVPNMMLFGIKDPDSPDIKCKIGVIPFSFSNLFANKIAYQLALFGGIGIRYGCHCAHIIVKRLVNLKPFLEPVQRMIVRLFPKLKLPGVARASIGLATTEKDVDRFIDTLKLIASKDKTMGAKLPTVEKQIEEFIRERHKLVYSEEH
ncbi:MAG TPA: aminotransferase class V-fold PLP-dependent enzyme [Lentimicrobium sp.]|nr:aminotransferase class V-fold PLP-dependent enzyme [Lentimicrobium sp.]